MKLIRIWSEHDLSGAKPGDTIKVSTSQMHYIQNVMRRKIGDVILLFNKHEWRAEVLQNGVRLQEMTRSMTDNAKHTSIAIACIKKPKMEWLVEKLTEIGVSEIFLLLTEYTQPVHYNFARLRAIITEAAEQSGRLDIPIIHEPQKLRDFLKQNQMNKILCHNNSTITSIHNISHTCLMIGPEGGWSERELTEMAELQTICFNENILRAETAAIVALGIAMIWERPGMV